MVCERNVPHVCWHADFQSRGNTTNESLTSDVPFFAVDNDTLFSIKGRPSYNDFDHLFGTPGQNTQFSSTGPEDSWMPYHHPIHRNHLHEDLGQGLTTCTSGTDSTNTVRTEVMKLADVIPAFNWDDPPLIEAGAVGASFPSTSESGPELHAAETNVKDDTKKTRPICTVCKKSFSREADLRRHGYKHSTRDPRYQCGVKGCAYGGSARPDKLASHIKNCHLNGNENLGVINIHELYTVTIHFLPGSGDCALSSECLKCVTPTRIFYWNKFRFSTGMSNILTQDGTGIKRMTRADAVSLRDRLIRDS